MRRRPWSVALVLATSPLAALAALAVLAGCAGVAGPSSRGSPDPGIARRDGAPAWRGTTLGDAADRPVADHATSAGDSWDQWIVEAGLASGAVDEAGSPSSGDLIVTVRADDPTRAVETASVEAGTPVAFVVGTVRWPSDGADAAGLACAGREVRVEWLVCLRARGTCAVEVDAVPRLVGGGSVTVLERYRIRRTVPLDEALVVGAPAGRAAAADGVLVVGGPASRFVLRIRS